MQRFALGGRRAAAHWWRAALPAGLAALLLLTVHVLSALHSSSHEDWDAGVAFGSDAGASLDGQPGSQGPQEILIRSLGRKRQRRQAASMPITGASLAAALASGGSGGGPRGSTLQPPRMGSGGGGGDSSGKAGGAAKVAEASSPPSKGSVLFVTFGNIAFFEFTHNWVLNVKRLGVPYVVGALDQGMTDKCTAAGFPVLNLWQQEEGDGSGSSSGSGSGGKAGSTGFDADTQGESGEPSDFFRANFTTFRHMGASKVQLTLSLLEADNGIEAVVVSDSDTVWLRDPSEYFEQHPTADWFISTDCLSHETEVAWAPSHNQPRCGHIPGNIWGRAYNTGVFAVRNRPAAKQVLGLWRDFLEDPQRTTTMGGTNSTFGITDQLALNILLEESSEWKLDADPEDVRTTLMRNGTLRLHPLPVLQFASGHTAFVQRLPWKHGVEPYVVHATFQRFSTGLSRYGKRGRFRQFGMWLLDGQEYYAPPGARYLTYQNDVRQYMDDLTKRQYDGALPLLYKHVIAVSYQLAQFRDALAASRMLNRTLVLPKSWCWCDYDWTPHVVERCKIRGSDLRLPFECPADFIFHIPLMDLHPNLASAYRVPGFLEDPRAPAELRLSRAEVRVSDRPRQLVVLAGSTTTDGPAGGTDDGTTTGGAAVDRTVLAASDAAAGVLYLASTQQELLAVAQPLQPTVVLELTHMRPGLLRGFDRLEDSVAFDTVFANITDELYWCCAAEGDLEKAAFWYELPRPFSDMHTNGYTPWVPPVMHRPAWCDDTDLSEEEQEWTAFANHPCQFLGNATAAAIAAALS